LVIFNKIAERFNPGHSLCQDSTKVMGAIKAPPF